MPGGKIDIRIEPDARDFPGKLKSALGPAAGIASTIGRGIGLAIAGGTALAAVGLRSIIKTGVEYQGNLNELQAVTGATAIQMTQVGQVAKKLGADMTLPATSAADAAAAMVELSKGGLNVQQSMEAAKGTLQLAAAAQVDAAQAAEIQSAALNQFGLSASEAGRVADILANTANASAGSILDMANSLKYVGPVARSLRVPIEQTATAIGLLSNNGIQSEQAGTSLRSMLASLASPSKNAASGLKTLGVVAFDSQGKFVGLRSIVEQLAKAKGKLTDSTFQQAAADAFGNEALSAVNALANSGVKSFDDMATAVTRSGGAAEVAAAKTKGLGGAWEGLLSQLETVGISIFEAIDGPLEKAVRGAATAIEKYGPAVARGIENIVSAGELFGPSLAQAIESRADVVLEAVTDVFRPLAAAVAGVINDGINVAIRLWNNFTSALDSVVKAAKPVAKGIADAVQSAREGGGPIAAAASAFGLLGDAAQGAFKLLVPIGSLLGSLLGLFAQLPGPVQTAVVSLGLLAAFRSPLASLGATIQDRVTAPFRAMGQEVQLQRTLLTGSTEVMSRQIGNVGLAFAALESRVPVLGRMAESFRNASTAAQGFVTHQAAVVQTASGVSGQMTGVATAVGKTEGAFRSVAGAAAGTAAALGTGLKAAAGGLVSLFGGPWGLALVGATVGLSLLASSQEKAATRTREHAASVNALAAALEESSGFLTANVRAAAAREAANKKLADTDKSLVTEAKKFGISLDDITDSMVGQSGTAEELKAKLQGIIDANTRYATSAGGAKNGRINDVVIMNDQAKAAQAVLRAIDGLGDAYKVAQEKRKNLDDAIRSGKAGMLEASESGKTLSSAMQTLADRTASADDRARGLRRALDAITGNAVSYDKAMAGFSDVMDRVKSKFKEAADEAAASGKSLVDSVTGGINATLPKGRELIGLADDLGTSMATAATKAFDMAGGVNNIGPATEAARSKVAEARKTFIDAAVAAGIGAKEAEKLADRYGLVPDKVSTLIDAPGMDQTTIELLLLQANVKAVPGEKKIITSTPLSDAAIAKLQEVGIRVERIKDKKQIVLYADSDQFNSAVAQATRPATKVITIKERIDHTGDRRPGGTGRFDMARGGILVAAYAAGGVHPKLTPMSGGVARVVPPNTWRVVGDRIRDDEAYIPINQSRRSQSILEHTANRMGYQLVRMFAAGGMATAAGSTTVQVSGSGGQFTGTLVLSTGELVGVIRGQINEANKLTAQSISYGRRG
ncbi:phage tail tape measure protein [Crossiella sp. CA-258035]|uniref:phage tail tape measure protein n=1 Tax=Crossiella sp. CA-258035 TaxID=2981138 RepID=UPI0024BC0901|nr:phage tail tape measure protein [Crossiella sp. CA-258035]WHT21023.1 phage tail tape measure protein [Crossiella sp. CA-258035]